jgi:hypothetical protein
MATSSVIGFIGGLVGGVAVAIAIDKSLPDSMHQSAVLMALFIIVLGCVPAALGHRLLPFLIAKIPSHCVHCFGRTYYTRVRFVAYECSHCGHKQRVRLWQS